MKIVNRNLLDEIFYDEILQESNVLKSTVRLGSQIFEQYDSLTEEIFYLLYKIIIDIEKDEFDKQDMTLRYLVLEFSKSIQLEKVRKRTAGDLQLTAICLKFILDELSLKIRGNRLFKKADNSFNQLKELRNNIDYLEQEKSRIEDIINIMDNENISPYSDKIKESIQKILNSSNNLSQKNEMETFQKILEFTKDFVEGSSSYDDMEIDSMDSRSDENSNEETLRKKTEEAIKDAKSSYDNNENQKGDDSSILEDIMNNIANDYESDGKDKDAPEEESDQSPNDILDSTKEETKEETNMEGTTKGDFEDALDKEIKEAEKQFEDYKIKSFEIVEGKYKDSENKFISESTFDDDYDSISIEDGTPDDDIEATDTNIEKLDPKSTNEFLEGSSNSKFNQNTGIEIDNLQHYLNNIINKISETKTSIFSREKEIKELYDTLKIDRVLNESIGKIASFKTNTKNLSITENSIKQMKFDDVIKFTKRLNSPETLNFLNKVGKKRETARKVQKERKRSKDLPTDKVMLSDDLDNMIDDELMNFSIDIDAFENDFIDRYLHENILSHERIRKTAKHKGPIILCYDGSGSMEGDKIEETKAHIVSFIEVAKIQKRKMIIIQFASENEPLYIKEINPSRVHVQDIIDIMDTFICGGTDFEKPLKMATQYILSDKYKQADILFITDGICSISDEFKKHFLEVKVSMDFKLYAIIMHANTYSDYGDLGDISDEVMEIRQMNISNWNEKISERIFSI